MDYTNCSGFRKYGCGFRKIAYFWSDLERYSVLGICLWNPKRRRRSNKSNKIGDSATNLILACCEIRLPFTECTVWLRNETLPFTDFLDLTGPLRLSLPRKRRRGSTELECATTLVIPDFGSGCENADNIFYQNDFERLKNCFFFNCCWFLQENVIDEVNRVQIIE